MASEEEMDFSRSFKSQEKQADDGIDPQIYAMFKKMMKQDASRAS